ncbi:MAG: ABC transporter ATP-binding protein [Acidobacteriota bacterium]|nr:ABC transporter ATP-binding protein [Acidobacteriota bacterium]
MTEQDGRKILLELKGVSKSYRSGPKRLHVLRQIDLTLYEGEMLAVVGPSGSGKTTLLNVIAGLDPLDEGSIVLGGRELTALGPDDWDHVRQHDIGFVFQFNQLLPEFTALENVTMPGLLTGRPKEEVAKKAQDLLERMGMGDRLDHRPAQLSGGEQQRTAIARALINGPRVVLADEPTGSLDQNSGRRVFDLLASLQHELKISCVVVTHNPALADLCARIHKLGSLGPSSAHDASTVGVSDV